jgi:hypothetical protein
MIWLLERHPTRAEAADVRRRRLKGVTGMLPSKRSVAAVTAVLSAVALAAPIADAGAATTPGTYPGFSLTSFFSLPGFSGVPLTFVFPSVVGTSFTKGPTVVGSVFNGATVVQVVNGAAASSVLASP